jgi:uncharacterized protein (TIGR04255 family)
MKSRDRKRPVGRPPDLPDFKRPPIYELVLSIQFAQTNLRNIDIGSIWRLFRNQYSTVEEHPPLAPVFEKYGLPSAQLEVPQFIISTTPGVLRYWFVSADGNELLQVQADRLIHNWRQASPKATYPRYEPLRARFEREVRKIEKFLEAQKLGSIKPNQCEVSYINHISLGESIEPDDKLDEIFTTWQEVYNDEYLKRIERGQFAMSYLIPGDQQQEPFGRLHVLAQPGAVRATSERIMQFNLTVRGKPDVDTVESALKWLDKGRYVVVRAFAALTTKKMHRIWGRTDG